MEKKLQDRAWASLPDDFKKEVRETAKAYIAISNRGGMSQFEYGALCRLNSLFGRHNLTASECGNLGEDSENSHKSEDKDLNLCELLQGCEGVEFYSPYLGKCVLEDLDWGDDDHCIKLKNRENGQWVAIPSCGHEEGGELMLYPSKDVRTWDGWEKPKIALKVGDKVKIDNILSAFDGMVGTIVDFELEDRVAVKIQEDVILFAEESVNPYFESK
jgi:hypothetical protein